MDEINVPYIVHEGIMARQERIIRRLVIVIIVTILLLFASNAAWLWAWNQYEYVAEGDQTVTVDGKEGTANYIGVSGSIINGKDYSEKEDPQTHD